MVGQSAQSRSSTSSNTYGNKTLTIIAVVIVVWVILALAGYFVQIKSNETIIDKATNGDGIQNNGKKSTIDTNDGKITIGQGEIPKSFPLDVSVYEGVEVQETTEAENGVSITLKTSDSISKVTNFYKKDLAKKGWKGVTSSTFEGSSLITAKKGNRELVISVTIDELDNKTKIATVIDKIK